ncbi:MAG: glutamate racemase [Pseudomonadota bacterium]
MIATSSPSAPHALIFDSGVGGLSIAQQISRTLPQVHQSYLADDAYRPYGEKTEKALRRRLPDLLVPVCDMLRPDIVVIACNTASTTALPAIRASIDIPVVGVVPAIKPAAALSQTRSIAVLGTPGTVRRAYVDELIAAHAADCHVRLSGSLALVEQAERKLSDRPVDLDVLRHEIASLFAAASDPPIDSVVLACTHFPLLRDELEQVAPHPVAWIDSGEAVARRVADLLERTSQYTGEALARNTAFLTGPNHDEARAATFTEYGFPAIVSLTH